MSGFWEKFGIQGSVARFSGFRGEVSRWGGQGFRGGGLRPPAEGMLIIICVYYRILGIIFSGPKTQFHQCKSFTKLILISGLFGASIEVQKHQKVHFSELTLRAGGRRAIKSGHTHGHWQPNTNLYVLCNVQGICLGDLMLLNRFLGSILAYGVSHPFY